MNELPMMHAGPFQIILPLNFRKCVNAITSYSGRTSAREHCLLCVIVAGAYIVSPDPDWQESPSLASHC